MKYSCVIKPYQYISAAIQRACFANAFKTDNNNKIQLGTFKHGVNFK